MVHSPDPPALRAPNRQRPTAGGVAAPCAARLRSSTRLPPAASAPHWLAARRTWPSRSALLLLRSSWALILTAPAEQCGRAAERQRAAARCAPRGEAGLHLPARSAPPARRSPLINVCSGQHGPPARTVPWQASRPPGHGGIEAPPPCWTGAAANDKQPPWHGPSSRCSAHVRQAGTQRCLQGCRGHHLRRPPPAMAAVPCFLDTE